MIPKPYANISLDAPAPAVTMANFAPMRPMMPPTETPSVEANAAALGTAAVNLKRRRFADQGGQIKGAMSGTVNPADGTYG